MKRIVLKIWYSYESHPYVADEYVRWKKITTKYNSQNADVLLVYQLLFLFGREPPDVTNV